MLGKRRLAIIGLGPRGSYALECFLREFIKFGEHNQLQILLFEETGKYGYGHVYDVGQVDSNWINVSERALVLDGRESMELNDIKIPAFPSYHDWAGLAITNLNKRETDSFPPRAKIGAYLRDRFQSLVDPLLLSKIVTIYKDRILKIDLLNQDKISIESEDRSYENIDEVLLTIGHQPTELSHELRSWDVITKKSNRLRLFTDPYPTAAIINSEDLSDQSRIAIRGCGLAMIDVVRAIACKFGKFVVIDPAKKTTKYKVETDLTGMFIPYSLDGLFPSPKPLNKEIDDWFKPTGSQIINFENKIGDPDTQSRADSPRFLISEFATIAADIYKNLKLTTDQENISNKEIEDLVKKWLSNNNYEHPTIISANRSAQETMQDHVAMATGMAPISLDYCIGQVWRHCQPSIYDKLSYNACSEKVFAEIIALDESTKRYSYGPPVESIQQLLALVEAGVMTLKYANDPSIKLDDNGWQIVSNGDTATANMMINSVLDSPKIKSVSSPIVRNLLSNDIIQAVHDELGIMTDKNGYTESNKFNGDVPVALLGRLAKGTIIGVDAILECFGNRALDWAAEAVKRYKQA